MLLIQNILSTKPVDIAFRTFKPRLVFASTVLLFLTKYQQKPTQNLQQLQKAIV